MSLELLLSTMLALVNLVMEAATSKPYPLQVPSYSLNMFFKTWKQIKAWILFYVCVYYIKNGMPLYKMC